MISSNQKNFRVVKIADTDHEIFPLLKQRYSPRIFQENQISEEHLHQLFEAVRWSASNKNLQPWRFIYGQKGSETFAKILKCLTDDNRKWAINAAVLMVSAYKEKMDGDKDNFHALHDLGLSLGSMTVQAQYLGIALHHMAGIDWQRAQDIFNVPKGFHVTTAIAVGYYGGDLQDLPEELRSKETTERKRIEQKDFVFQKGWEQ